MTTGLLVVDVQPAYSDFCDSIARKVAQRINNTVKPVAIMWVGDGITDDDEAGVREYLRAHGARPGRLSQARFIEKDYGFFRDWMDEGADSEDIIKVGSHMLTHGLYSSEDVDLAALYEGPAPDLPETGLLHRPSFDDRVLRSFTSFETCGGGARECLAEIELWLQMTGKPFTRLDSLVYG